MTPGLHTSLEVTPSPPSECDHMIRLAAKEPGKYQVSMAGRKLSLRWTATCLIMSSSCGIGNNRDCVQRSRSDTAGT